MSDPISEEDDDIDIMPRFNTFKKFVVDIFDQSHLQDKVQLIREAEIIKATNLDDARQKFKENLSNKFGSGSESIIKGGGNASPDYYETSVDNIEFLDEVEDKKLIAAIHFLLENHHKSSPLFWLQSVQKYELDTVIPMTPEITKMSKPEKLIILSKKMKIGS